MPWPGSEDDGRDVYFHDMFRIFIGLIIVAFCSSAAAQSDRYFPNVSAEFTLAWPCIDPNFGPYTSWEIHTFLAEPTIEFDGMTWGQLDPPPPTGLITVDGDRILYHGLTWFHAPPDTTVVLYDFGLAEGDTAYWDAYYGFGHAIVQTIDTIEVVGRSRRRFHLNNGDIWLEGIGSLMGLFRPWYVTPLGCDHPAFSYCADYVDEDGVAYSICSEDIPLGQSSQTAAVERIHPNPSNGRFTVTTMSASGSYRVVDTRGSEIRRGLLQGNETVVDLIAAAPGLYVLDVNGQRTKLIIE